MNTLSDRPQHLAREVLDVRPPRAHRVDLDHVAGLLRKRQHEGQPDVAQPDDTNGDRVLSQ